MNKEFWYESKAFKELLEGLNLIINKLNPSLPKDNRIELKLFNNVEIYDPTFKSFNECDIILLTQYFFGIIELKHWYGKIQIGDYFWAREGQQFSNPHKNNNYKCKLLKSYIEKKYPAISGHLPYIYSICLFTDENAEITGLEKYKFENIHKNRQITLFKVQESLKHFENLLSFFSQTKPLLQKTQFTNILNEIDIIAKNNKNFSNQIKGFKIIKQLNKSPFYVEYLAQSDISVDTNIKRIRVFGEPSSNKSVREKQTRNYDLLSKISPHPNILKSYSYPNTQNLVIDCSDWNDANTLRDILNIQKKIEHKKTLKYALDILSGLIHLHKNQIIHRDLRPENILIYGETAQLMNFDFAYYPQADTTVMSDEERQIITPYRPPEIEEGDENYLSDIFSFGAMLYEMLSGKIAFNSWHDIRSGTINLALDCENPNILEQVIKPCLQIDRDRRPFAENILKIIQKYLNVEKGQPYPIENRELNSGETFNCWEIVEKIGKGATSQIYYAQNADADVTLKIYNIDVPIDICKKERDFLRRCNSAYIQKLNTFAQWEDGRYMLELEYINGKSLRAQINGNNTPSIDTFTNVAKKLLYALKDLYQEDTMDKESKNPIIHNDLNPSNIILVNNDPKIIDFGSASFGGNIKICGKTNYIATDLIQKGEMISCENGDLFSLSVTLFEWLTGKHPFNNKIPQETSFIGLESINNLPLRLNRWFDKALNLDRSKRFNSASEMFKELEECLIEEEKEQEDISEKPIASITSQKINEQACLSAEFVDYLNTLHNISSENKNAIAESQSVNKFFGKIYCSLKINDEIFDHLNKIENTVVFLTGHAGDGKSTIALEIYKRFKNIPLTEKLSAPLKQIENLKINGKKIFIVKDISEFPVKERLSTFKEALKNDNSSWLIISNSGPLLDTFNSLSSSESKNKFVIEDKILKSLNNHLLEPFKEELVIKDFGKNIFILNLTMMDNVPYASKIIKNIIKEENWQECNNCLAKTYCHIYNNIKLLQESDLSLSKIQWIYRRLSDYNSRITLRQMVAHIAYSITGGISCSDIKTSLDINLKLIQNTFSNNFWGMCGEKYLNTSDELYVIKLLNELEFGAKPYPQTEQYLYKKDNTVIFNFSDTGKNIFATMQEYYARLSSRKRQILRRYVYFWSDLKNPLNNYYDDFLKSPMLIKTEQWYEKGISTEEKNKVKKECLKMLLEVFTGFSSSHYTKHNILYITLKRETDKILQPVQIILRKCDFDHFDIQINKLLRQIKLKNIIDSGDDSLYLALPLLDYIYYKNIGQIGQNVDELYKNQINIFKNSLLNKIIRNNQVSNKIGLLCMQSNNSLSEIKIVLDNNKIEVE